MRTSVLPFSSLQNRPAFWGIDRDFKDVVDGLESVWQGSHKNIHDFREVPDAFLLSLDIPGASDDTISMEVIENQILITAQIRSLFAQKNESSKELKHKVVIPKGVDRDGIEARAEHGILYIVLPKASSEKPRKVELGNSLSLDRISNLLESEV